MYSKHTRILNTFQVPRVVEGSGKIIDVSEASPLVKKDGEKNMNELLYDIYKRFKKDTTGELQLQFLSYNIMSPG